MTINTVKALCEAIWKMERYFDLLEWEISGIKPWQASRMNLYYALANKANVLELPHGLPPHKTFFSRLKRGLRAVRGTLLLNPFLDISKLDTVVFEGKRNAVLEGNTVDPYTYKLTEQLASCGKNLLLFNLTENTKDIEVLRDRRRSCDSCDLFIYLGTLAKRKRLNNEDIKFIGMLQDYLRAEFEFEIDLLAFFEKQLNRFYYKHYYFNKLFKTRKPENIYCICSYWELAPVIKAARDLGIRVIELQHGTFSEYHLGYSFPGFEGTGKLEYFPDEFHVWNEYWRDRIEFPIAKEQVIVAGHPFMENKINMYKNIRKKHQIVVLSQGVIGRKLADLIFQNIDKLKEFEIRYKLHPGEYNRWSDYSSLVKLSKYPNVKIESNTDLYGLFAESEIQIGVFSTAIYEGMAFGIETVLAELPGIEYMSDLLSKNKAVTFDRFIEKLTK